jgi:hypothetical protein
MRFQQGHGNVAAVTLFRHDTAEFHRDKIFSVHAVTLFHFRKRFAHDAVGNV